MQAQSPDFESIKQTNVYDVEYWSARDLAPLLGYVQWRRFQEAITRAMTACEQSGNVVADHFAGAGKMIQTGKSAVRKVKDYNLTRLACYLIAQNGDPRKQEIAAAQLYFAISTRQNEMHQIREEQEKRLATRLKVSESYKQLAEAAYQSGVNTKTFGLFVDAGYLGLHHHNLEELKQRKGIPEREDYLDNITREELAAIDFKNILTEGKLTDEQMTGLENAMQTHYFVGSEVRKAVEAVHSPMPEDLPTAPSIRKMVEERRRKQKRSRSVPPTEEQEQLF